MMNIDGYQKYLKKIGKWDSYASNEIQKLIKIEKDLQIDLDDFIPYDGNYSVCDKLDGMMTDEMKFNEPLVFAINRYMAYKMSNK